MTSVFATRRRAEEFNSLVEGSPSPGSDVRYEDFLGIVAQMRDLDVPAPRTEFVAALRARLMAAADTVLVSTPADRLTLPPRRTHRERRVAAVVGGVAIMGATTSMALGAQSALPGDMLYPVKRAMENAHTGLAVGDDAKGSTLLANAAGRLDEVSAMSTDGGAGNSGAIADTLNAFSDQASEASDLLLEDYASTGDEMSIVRLHEFTAASMARLAALEAEVPSTARAAIIHAARVLTQIDEAAAQACPSCAGTGIDKIPAGLASGGLVDEPGSALSSPQLRPASTTPHRAPQHHAGVKADGASGPSASDPNAPTVPPVQPAGGEEATGGTGGTSGSDGPVQDLTEGLTGAGSGGSSEPTSGPSGVPGVPGPDDVVGDVSTGLGG